MVVALAVRSRIDGAVILIPAKGKFPDLSGCDVYNSVIINESKRNKLWHLSNVSFTNSHFRGIGGIKSGKQRMGTAPYLDFDDDANCKCTGCIFLPLVEMVEGL
jgi:hypothetical protein